MKVYKFGGASVKDAAGVRNLQKIVSTQDSLFLIVSAMGKTTNALERVFSLFVEEKKDESLLELEQIHHYHTEIIQELWGKTSSLEDVEKLFSELEMFIRYTPGRITSMEACYDYIVSFGELISTKIISNYLLLCKIENKWIDMREVFVTSCTHKDANVLLDRSEARLLNEVSQNGYKVFVGQGFIGRATDRSVTTLGREGSDYSAACVANITNAESLTVWKDVDGILSADPKLFPNAIKIEHINYTDAIELAYSGAQIIHPKTIKPLQNKLIPLFVKPFSNPQGNGTEISSKAETVSTPIIILKKKQVLLTLKSKDLSFILEEKFQLIFDILAKYNIKTNLVHNTAVMLALCIEENWHLDELLLELQNESFEIECKRNVELLTIRHYNEEMYHHHATKACCLLRQTTTDTVRVVREC
ncbi:MAG: aspartate kinase [Alistipes sp.]|nr:aspartate kinase [Candidatus Alistipes equi]